MTAVRARGLLVGAMTAVVALAGCAGAATTAPTSTPTATSAPTAGPTASPAPTASAVVTSPSASRGMTLVSGTAGCTVGDMTEATEGQVTTYRGPLSCTMSMSDPRVSGDLQGELTIAYVELPGYKIDRWTDAVTITNAGGTWRGTGFGSEYWDETGGLRTTGTEVYVGEGGYAGLTLRTLLAQSPDWDRYIIAGWIEPAATPVATPSASVGSPAVAAERVLLSGTFDCGFPDGLKETTEGRITTYTGTIACTLAMSDPRASGEEVGEITMAYLKLPGYEIDRWTGATTLTNAGGSWRGTAFGSEYWDETGAVRTTGTAGYIGEGRYAGLTLRTLFAQGPGLGDGYIVAGWIEPAK